MNVRLYGSIAGIVAPPAFILILLLQDWLRQDFNSESRFISELAIGPFGWIQIANFVIHGVLCTSFAGAVAAELRARNASITFARMLMAYGIATVLAGLFVADPSDVQAADATWHGVVHLLIGVAVFSLLPVISWAFIRVTDQVPDWQPLRAAAVLASVATSLFWLAMLPGSFIPPVVSTLGPWIGAINRIVYGIWLIWLFLLAIRIRQSARASTSSGLVSGTGAK